jgi:hypothetical protein
LLVLSLQDVGVPTWQDVANLDAEPTEDELGRVLDDDSTAGALLWITPEVVDSPIIKKVEVPKIVERRRRHDGFFVQPVAAGGLDYDEAARVAGEHLGVEDLATWNLEKVDANPIAAAEAANIAELVLRRRVKEIAARLEPGDPVRLTIYTRARAPVAAGTAVVLDWSRRFDGRLAAADTWASQLLPALAVVTSTLREIAAGRRVEASGLVALPAAVALGAASLAPAGLELAWRQPRAGRPDQIWSLDAGRAAAPVDVDQISGDATSQEMAVVVSMNHDAEEALRHSETDVPKFRGYVRLRGQGGAPADLETPGQAADAAFRLIDSLGDARRRWRDVRRIHLFIAGPAGFAVLLGQLLNGLGPVQTYEHIPNDSVGHYRRAALLHPGA